MPLNSVQLYVHRLLDGLTIPGPPGVLSSTLDAYITPPTLDDMDNPKAYIWGGRQRARRQAMPRATNFTQSTGGFKYLDYTLSIYLKYLTNPQDPEVDQEFPIFIDTVLYQLWNTTMPIFIDSQGNRVSVGGENISQITSIGEEWDLDYPPEMTPATQRMLLYGCRIAMTLQEVIQA